MIKSGGYAIVSYNDTNIFSKVQGAYENQKPILFYDDDNTCYFIDTIKKNDDGDYVLTKGGKTFTVTSNNTLSSEGTIENHIYVTNYIDFQDDYDDEQFLTTNDYKVPYTVLLIYTPLNLDNTIQLQDLLQLVKENKAHVQLQGELLDSDSNYASTLLDIRYFAYANDFIIHDSQDNAPSINQNFNPSLVLNQII